MNKKIRTPIFFLAGLVLLGVGCNGRLTTKNFSQQAVVTSKQCPDGGRYDAILERCGTAIENDIQKLLPVGALLREVKPIVTYDDKPQTYIGIYVVDGKIDPPQAGIERYTTCPEETTGESITGVYHVFAYRSGSIFSDKTLPSSELGPISAFAWKNTMRNNFRYFDGPAVRNDQANDLELTKLINLKEYTGDGRQNDFILYGESLACGHKENAVVGYIESIDEVIFYPIVKGAATTYWMDNFVPDHRGSVQVSWNCGDHGSETETHQYYSFNQGHNAFVLEKKSEKPCE